jgi:cell division protein FtsA
MSSRKTTHSSDTLVGIDFGTTKICVVIGKKTGESIEIVGIGKQASMGIRKGVVVNIPMTVDALKKAVETAERMAGIKIASALVGIAGSHIKGFNSTGVVAIKDREVNRHDMDRALEAAKAVALPVDREIIHVIAQEYLINDQEGVKDPLGMSGVRLESRVHVVTGAVSSAQNIIKCVNMAGITATDIVLEPLASAEASLTEDEKELGVAIVDIGGGTTDVALFSRGSVVHSGVIAMGGNHITNDIAVGLRCSIQDAENIKVKMGCAMASLIETDEPIEVNSTGGRKREVTASVLAKIIEPRVEEIFNLVSREISSSGFRHILSTGVVLTGGASLIKGAPEIAEFILEMPVRRGHPQNIGGLVDIVSSPVYSTAVGLLLFGLKKGSRSPLSLRSDRNSYSRWTGRFKSWLGEVF